MVTILRSQKAKVDLQPKRLRFIKKALLMSSLPARDHEVEAEQRVEVRRKTGGPRGNPSAKKP